MSALKSAIRAAKSAKLVPFAALPKEAKSALMTYMDGDEEMEERLKTKCFGYATVPMTALQQAVMTTGEDIPRDFKDFEAYHKWYLSEGHIPNHGKSVWPLILSDFKDEVWQDGSHRFHSYAKKGLKAVPVVWFTK